MHKTSVAHRAHKQQLATFGIFFGTACTYLLYKFYLYQRKTAIRDARRNRMQAATDLNDYAKVFFGVIEETCGSPLLTACPHYVDTCKIEEKIEDEPNDQKSISLNETVVIFASGGWSVIPPSLSPLPTLSYSAPSLTQAKLIKKLSFLNQQSSQSDSSLSRVYTDEEKSLRKYTSLYWFARSLSKSFVFNASFAFFLSVLLRTYRKSQERAEKQRESQPFSAAAFLKTSSTNEEYPLYLFGDKVEDISLYLGDWCAYADRQPATVVCEIGCVNESKLNSFDEDSFAYNEVAALAESTTFGTMNIWQYAQKNGKLPSSTDESFKNVLWDKQEYKHPSAQDAWIVLTLENGEKYHFDMAKMQNQGEADFHWEGFESHQVYQTALETTAHPDNILQYACAPPSSKANAPYAPPPKLHFFTNAEFKNRRGVNITRRIEGAENIIKYCQVSVFVNDALKDPLYTEMENLTRQALRLRGLATTALYVPL